MTQTLCKRRGLSNPTAEVLAAGTITLRAAGSMAIATARGELTQLELADLRVIRME